MTHRCSWAQGTPLEAGYHDTEWGVPCFDDRCLFELLTLEGAQAGLSWRTILEKRANYRRAFADFDAPTVARFDRRRVERLLQDAGIVRHRGKIESTVNNARRVLEVVDAFGSLSGYLWQFVDGKPVRNRWQSYRDAPGESPQSRAMSRELRKRGFRFIGPTTCYAFMQAVGMVNDHEVRCFRHRQVGQP
ncbi:MAG TPA: DNA-3-methyladenine glycosylase I [Gammaproteobacteria bacterium]|nr:DNA-3-methyladenine glycosylase I [Gammaproteobacteria bacterium]